MGPTAELFLRQPALLLVTAKRVPWFGIDWEGRLKHFDAFLLSAQYWLGSILLAGVAGALVDGLYFSVKALASGRSPERVLQSIAGFWMDKAALDAGALSAWLGLATHVGLASAMATAYSLAACAPPVRNRPLSSGVVFGLALYGVMYLVVLPTRWPKVYPRFDGESSVMDILAHVGVGVAIASCMCLAWRNRGLTRPSLDGGATA